MNSKRKVFIRKMKMKDIKEVHQIINYFADEGEMLPRSLKFLYEGMRDYFVVKKNGEIVGCSALHFIWEDLAEIKSVAVKEKHQNQGIGSALVKACLKEAVDLGLTRVFLLTNKPKYFQKFGFKTISKRNLPKRIWGECVDCSKFPDFCDEIAMIKTLR